MNFRIASHVVAVEGTAVPQSFCVFKTDEPAEWEIVFGQEITVCGSPVHCFSMEDDTRCVLLRDGDSYCFTLGDSLSFRYDGGHTVRVCGHCSQGHVHFVLWMAYALLALQAAAVPVHSSTVVWGGKAVAVLGESGTGKSTHTGLWLKHIPGSFLLNDDSPVLTVENGVPMVYGSPWSGKTPCYKDESYPLAAIVRLRQAPCNKITPLGKIDAFAALYPSCPPAFAKDNALTDKLLDIVSPVITSVPSYTLDCLPDPSAAQLCHSTVFGTEA